MWAHGCSGLQGDETADNKAVTEALKEEPTDNLMPFSDLRPLTTKFNTKFCGKNRMALSECPVSFMRFYQSFQFQTVNQSSLPNTRIRQF